MTARPVKAAVCRSFGGPLQIEELSVRAPGPGEVGVRVAACAVCHSDVAFIEGAWGGALPTVFGHEAAGVVEEVGPGVSGLAAGDHVVVTLIRSCGRCGNCRWGQPALCDGLPPAGHEGVLADGDGKPVHQGMHTAAFSHRVTVHESQAVAVSPDISLEVASLLACGVLTGVGAVLNTAAVEAGSTVVVLGAGGVGLNCVQGARLAGAGQIIAADLVAAKLDAARAFGATDVIDAAARDSRGEVDRLTAGHGAGYVFVAAGAVSLIETGMTMLRRGGTLVIVGIPAAGAAVCLDPVAIADGSLRVLGSKMGASRPHEDIPRLVRLYQAGLLKLDELISERYEFGRINDAIGAARAGGQLRPVIVFGGGDEHGSPAPAHGNRQAPAPAGGSGRAARAGPR